MGTCVQHGQQHQLEFNTMDQIRLYENRHVYMDPEQELEWKRQNNGEVGLNIKFNLTINIQNMQVSMLKRQLEAEEQQKQQLLENQKIHQQMLNLYDASNESSNLHLDVELRSLNFQPSDKMQQRSPPLFEGEIKQERSFTQGQSSKDKNKEQIQQQESKKQLIDYLSKGEKDVLLQPLPSLTNVQANVEYVYEAFDSAEITPLVTPKQEAESECEELQFKFHQYNNKLKRPQKKNHYNQNKKQLKQKKKRIQNLQNNLLRLNNQNHKQCLIIHYFNNIKKIQSLQKMTILKKYNQILLLKKDKSYFNLLEENK